METAIEIKIGQKTEQFENWTEQMTGEYVSTEERKMLHISYCGELDSIFCGEMCVYSPAYYKQIMDESEDIDIPEHNETMGGFKKDYLYEITVPVGTYIQKYGPAERRFCITQKFSAKRLGYRISWALFVKGIGTVHHNRIFLF